MVLVVVLEFALDEWRQPRCELFKAFANAVMIVDEQTNLSRTAVLPGGLTFALGSPHLRLETRSCSCCANKSRLTGCPKCWPTSAPCWSITRTSNAKPPPAR